MARLTDKYMAVKLKIGWTPSDFARDFDLNSEEDFLAMLKKSFGPTTFSYYSKELMKNKKNTKRSKLLLANRNKIKVSSDITSNNDVTEESSIAISVENSNSKTVHDELTIIPHVDATSIKEETDILTNKLEKLIMTETSLKEALCEYEGTHKTLMLERRKLKEDLQAKKIALIELRAQLEQHSTECNQISEQINLITIQMSKVNEQISTTQKTLFVTQEKIKSLQKIVIFVYDNGDFDFDGAECTVPDTWNSLFTDLTTNELVEDLTVKQIRVLAKAIFLAKNLQEQARSFEFTFETELMQKVFEQLI